MAVRALQLCVAFGERSWAVNRERAVVTLTVVRTGDDLVEVLGDQPGRIGRLAWRWLLVFRWSTRSGTAAPLRTPSTWCCLLAWLRPLERVQLGWPHRTRVRGADGSARLPALRRPGRRHGRTRHRPCGPPGGQGFGRLRLRVV